MTNKQPALAPFTLASPPSFDAVNIPGSNNPVIPVLIKVSQNNACQTTDTDSRDGVISNSNSNSKDYIFYSNSNSNSNSC